MESLAHGSRARQDEFLNDLARQLETLKPQGVVIDWGQLDPAYRDDVTELLLRIATALHDRHLELWLSVPMGLELNVYDLEALSGHVDRFIAMLHDENSENDPPGPIASQEWFDGWVETLAEYGEPSQWIVALGAYGYDWTIGKSKAETVSFADIMTRAGRAGLTRCELDPAAFNPVFSYEDEGEEHSVWFLDAVTFLNQARNAREKLTGGIAISQLGTEDPAVWKVLHALDPPQREDLLVASLESIPGDSALANVGKGEFLSVEDLRSDGARRIARDEADRLTEVYETFPGYLTLNHHGGGEPDQVAITFDDGPDPKWTPRVLDILKAKGVHAAFFLVGSRIETNPELVERIVREGHEIGVHTYTHPNLAKVSYERALLELNATQRLIEIITGRSTILFRPPYNADSRPHDADEIAPVLIAQELGYITVTEDLDPEDWARPGTEILVRRVKQLRRAGGHIVLLHDAGGDRHQTLEALGPVIDYLQDRGDRIVSLGELLEESPDYLMPPFAAEQHSANEWISSRGFQIIHVVQELALAFLLVATLLTVLRTLLIAALAWRHRMRSEKPETGTDPFEPPVSVILAAYNEEKVIESTLRQLLRTRYNGPVEIVVVDDGSKDGTAERVARFARDDSRVHLIRQGNRGKATALQLGLKMSSHEILVMLDADTQFEPDTLWHLVQPFRDERVGAVSGHAKVGNLRTFTTRCQSLEYTCGFNLDRRAYHEWNCITVVPGAVSALRRAAVVRSGGISTETLAEDTDLTLCLHRHGFRVVYSPRAVAWTEAPETLRTLVKQRSRWAYGTLQCLWKHRDLTFNPRYRALGSFSLPGIWFFQILLVAIGPLMDAFLLLSLLASTTYTTASFYFAIFCVTDLFLAGLACFMEGEPLHRAWRILPMRFLYRPLLGWVIWKSLLKAIKGAWVQWGKLDRTASVPNRV